MTAPYKRMRKSKEPQKSNVLNTFLASNLTESNLMLEFKSSQAKTSFPISKTTDYVTARRSFLRYTSGWEYPYYPEVNIRSLHKGSGIYILTSGKTKKNLRQ